MLDEKDLQAIAQLMAGVEQRMDQKLAQQKREIIGEVKVLIEADVMPKFDLLADGLKAVNEKLEVLPDPDLLEKMQDELDLHHAMLKLHAKEITRLKQAQ